MGFEVIDFGVDLEKLINYGSGWICSLAEAAEQAVQGNNFISFNPLNVATVIYVRKNHFKVAPQIELRYIRPPPPQKLDLPKYDDFVHDSIKEFVIVTPIDAKGDYAVLKEIYKQQKIFSLGDLRYRGSPLSTPLQIDDARDHRVLVAAFGGNKDALTEFLEKMEKETKKQFYVRVEISRSEGPSFTTCTLQRFQAKNVGTLVIRSEDMGRKYLYTDDEP